MSGSYSLYRCAVLSTSSGSLSSVLDRNSPIHILPLGVIMGQQQVTDGLDIDNAAFCRWRETHLDEPTATMPPPADYLANTFHYLISEGYHEVIVTTLSHQLSDTAAQIRDMAPQFPQLTIHVVDTGSCCMPEGFFALEALRLLKEGQSPREVVDYLERLKKHCHIIFGVASLQPLTQGGKLKRIGAKFNDWLGLRTVLKFAHHELSHLASVGDDEEMFDAVIRHIRPFLDGKQPNEVVLAGLYSGNAAMYRRFADYFHHQTGWQLGCGIPVSPAVAVHVGIDNIGIGLVERLKA